MNPKAVVGGMLVALVLALPGSGSAALNPVSDVIREYDANGEVVWEQMTEPSNPLLLKTVHYLRLGAVPSSDEAKPGGGGSPGTDCSATNYRLAGWHWTSAYRATSASYASIVSSALSEWDANTAASISAGAGSGKQGTAGTYDGVNQLEWVNIGASTTIAVTTTWSYRGSGEAVESDGQYNTYYPWSTSGASGAMDVENIAQHETGHTFGLNHPSGTCLTMYAYADYGETQKRTLGDGDILGIKAIYGN
jgi:hypothetical protein